MSGMTAARMSELPEAIQAVEVITGSLEKAVETLEGRLEPVTRPSSPTLDKERAQQPGFSTKYASCLGIQADRLLLVEGRLKSLLDRIEV